MALAENNKIGPLWKHIKGARRPKADFFRREVRGRSPPSDISRGGGSPPPLDKDLIHIQVVVTWLTSGLD